MARALAGVDGSGVDGAGVKGPDVKREAAAKFTASKSELWDILKPKKGDAREASREGEIRLMLIQERQSRRASESLLTRFASDAWTRRANSMLRSAPWYLDL